jgi:hypothetical protein
VAITATEVTADSSVRTDQGVMHLPIDLTDVAEVNEALARLGAAELIVASLLTVPAVLASI